MQCQIFITINKCFHEILHKRNTLSHTLSETVPAIMLSALSILLSTCSTSPTSVHACRLRMLFFKIAVNMLHTSAWQVTSHLSSKSTMQVMPSPSWMMKFISKSKWPPTSFQTKGLKDKIKKNLKIIVSKYYSIFKVIHSATRKLSHTHAKKKPQ